MGRVRYPIYTNSREEKCSTWPEQCLKITTRCVNSFSMTAAPVKCVYTSPLPGRKVEVCKQVEASPGRREWCNSPSQGMRFCQSHQSHLEHLGILMATSVVPDAAFCFELCLLEHLTMCLVSSSTTAVLGGDALTVIESSVSSLSAIHWVLYWGGSGVSAFKSPFNVFKATSESSSSSFHNDFRRCI